MCMHKIIKDYMYMYSTVHQSPIMIPKDQLMSNQLGFGSIWLIFNFISFEGAIN